MSVLTWNALGEKRYELGISKGVLYTKNQSGEYVGVPWNGLTSAEIQPVIEEPDTVFIDSTPVAFIPNRKIFEGSLSAYTYPDEFDSCLGQLYDPFTGMLFGDQLQDMFRLSYVTNIGDDVNGSGAFYKIHLLYNLMATPESITYDSIGEDADPSDFSWELIAIPETNSRSLPTAHVVFDSRRTPRRFMRIIEDYLYGTETSTATMPNLQTLVDEMIQNDLLIIRDNNDGTWSAYADDDVDIIRILEEQQFSITRDTITQIDPNTFKIESG